MNTERKIEYLIKMVPQLKYARDLAAGNLFMRPVDYYHRANLEKGQNDVCEGAIVHGLALYKNAGLPIYCMTAVFEDELEDKSIIPLDARMIVDFNCGDGYVVVLEYDKFLNELERIECDGSAIHHGLVEYGSPTMALSQTLLVERGNDNIFIKHSNYSYQKEYRVVIGTSLPVKETGEYIAGDVPISLRQESIVYSIKGGIDESLIGIYAVKDMVKNQERYYLDLNDGVNHESELQ